ncbi:sigma-70 family RNA polymerase sigma factor [Photobacterium sp. GJ3]|uniref:sigma-70 family RNA polymerase sigma factor n=1 Tax=Photobacterium sp. GJ3 TaxID=2829502 RepID=UPI001B8CC6FF|nr:sigma-70 family RNA polymerase sigma factor [Photobacterium sp. GJ3]QUJ68528.1 sigma-70 family RNA polymerase sigma factor [Photobacterium sp. GJ3]
MNAVIQKNTALNTDDEHIREQQATWGKVAPLLSWCDIIAKQFVRKHKYNHEMDFDDYKNIAVIALYEALNHFNPNKGSLKPYCFQYMYYEINRVLIRSNYYLFNKVSLHAEDGSDTEQLLEMPGISALSSSLNGSQEQDENEDVAAFIYIDKYLTDLGHDKQKVILEHYFNEVPLRELALSMGRTPSRISQIHHSALKELSRKINV